MHETLCYVWFSGAWNQGTWMGLGNTVFSQLYPAEAEQHTPWQYPYMSRRQHAEKVYSDYFDEQIMMEDADGYNQIWYAPRSPTAPSPPACSCSIGSMFLTAGST